MGEDTFRKLIKELPLCSSFSVSLLSFVTSDFPTRRNSSETVDKEVLVYLKNSFIDPHVLKNLK